VVIAAIVALGAAGLLASELIRDDPPVKPAVHAPASSAVSAPSGPSAGREQPPPPLPSGAQSVAPSPTSGTPVGSPAATSATAAVGTPAGK
ncbi:MAG TPA: hypothetical protein VK601_00035, partial [Kofleriaceae bacterium]|nr:hypothetical protein [Kofleriaceae bacterium]